MGANGWRLSITDDETLKTKPSDSLGALQALSACPQVEPDRQQHCFLKRHRGPLKDAVQLSHGEPERFLEVGLEGRQGVVRVEPVGAPSGMVDTAGAWGCQSVVESVTKGLRAPWAWDQSIAH